MEIYLRDVLVIALQFCFIVQLYFLISNHSRLVSYKPFEGLMPVTLPVSVIISARNEAKNLAVNLPFFLEQNYPDFEVVVINDCSIDDSEHILKEIQQKYPALKIVTVTEHIRFKTGKKFALTMGIKAAKNEYLLFTDADCKPASADWITRMAAHFTTGAEIVIGYSPFYKTSNYLNPLLRFETLKAAINYLSAAIGGNAYMGVGRNLGYTKTLFFKCKGFASHMHVLSGDDDLFVNQNARPGNTEIEIHPDAFTFSGAKTTLGSLFMQKKRHMGVGKLYKNKHRKMLSIDALSGILFYILLVLCLVYQAEPLLALGLFVFRLVCQVIIYRKVFKKLNSIGLLWHLPIFDVVYYVYLNIFGLIGTFIKTTQWK